MIFVKNSRGGREGGQHDQHFVKNKFVKNRLGGRGTNLNLDNVFRYTVVYFRLPLSQPLTKLKLIFAKKLSMTIFVSIS